MLELPSPQLVAVDTECSGLHPDDGATVACVAVAWVGGSLALPFDQGVRDKFPAQQMDLLGEEDPNLGLDEWEEMLAWLQECEIVMHNAKYDLTMLRAGTRHWPGADLTRQLVADTMLASAILDPTLSKGLENACKRADLTTKVGLEELKGWLKRHKFKTNRYDLVPWELAKPYVTGDAEMTLDLHEHQQDRLEPKAHRHLKKLIDVELQLMPVLLAMEERGILYDGQTSIEAAEALEQKADDIEKGMPFKCDVTAAKAWFFEKEKLPPMRMTEKKREPALDEEQVREWIAEEVPWAKEYDEVAKMRRAVSMWYRGYPEKIGADGRLRCSFRQGHVKSGRMSVERVQLQAMPKEDKEIEGVAGVRTLLQAEEGMGLWNLDLSQAELRVATYYSGCKRMWELLAEGADLHGVTCEGVLGVSRDDPEWKTKRDIAKRLTFGSIFQIGGKKFQATLSKLADIHLPLEECQQLVSTWRQMYPEFGVAYRKADQMAQRQGFVNLLPGTPLKQRSYFGERDWTHTAWNRIVQGSLAQAFKQWMIQVEQNWPGLLILTVHDSLVLEAPIDEGDEVSAAIAEAGAKLMTSLFMGEDQDVQMSVDVERYV